MLHSHERTLCKKAGKPRVWLDGRTRMGDAGFVPGAVFTTDIQKNKVVFTISEFGDRTVSCKQKDGKIVTPVIDVNSKDLFDAFTPDMIGGKVYVRYFKERIEVSLMPLDEAIAEREANLMTKLRNGQPLEISSLFTGTGFLDNAFKDGMSNAGIATKTVFCNELDDRFLTNGLDNNSALKHAQSVQGSISQLWRFNVPRSDIFLVGLPCVGFSKSGRVKNKISSELEHEKAGHLFIYLLQQILTVNPSIIVIENTPEAMNSVSFGLIESVLQENGWNTQKTIINSREYGALEERKRTCFVGVSQNIEFELSRLQAPGKGSLKVGDILDEHTPDTAWSEMAGLRRKEQRDIVSGKGFRMHTVSADSDRVSTLGAGYAKNRSTETKIEHPTESNLLRLFSKGEHSRIKGYCESMVAGLSATVAHMVLGNGVVKHGFMAFANELGNQLNESLPQNTLFKT